MRLPAVDVWLHHSVTEPSDDPSADMRKLEAIGKARFGRLSYSFAVHPSGVILEGQGLHVGTHTQDRNSTSFGVVLIGNYEVDPLTKGMVNSVADLLVMFGEEGWGPARITGGHRDVKQTACPGGNAYAAIPDMNDLARTKAEQEQKEGVMPYREADRKRDEETNDLATKIFGLLTTDLGGLGEVEDALNDGKPISPRRAQALTLRVAHNLRKT